MKNKTRTNRTIATTFRGDIKTITTLAMYFHDKGEPVRSLSEILRLTTEGLSELIIQQQPEYKVNSTEIAYHTLRELGIINLNNPSFPNRQSLVKELSIENLNHNRFSPDVKISPENEQSFKEAMEKISVSSAEPSQELKEKLDLIREE